LPARLDTSAHIHDLNLNPPGSLPLPRSHQLQTQFDPIQPIHLKQSRGGASDGAHTYDFTLPKVKMLRPVLPARME